MFYTIVCLFILFAYRYDIHACLHALLLDIMTWDWPGIHTLSNVYCMLHPLPFWLIWPSSQLITCNQAVASLSCIIIICIQCFLLHYSREHFHMWHIYWHSSLINHQCITSNLGICHNLAFEGHIYCWHIFCSSRVNKCCSLLIFHGYVQQCKVYMWTTVIVQWDIFLKCGRPQSKGS